MIAGEVWCAGEKPKFNLDQAGKETAYQNKTGDPEAESYDEANEIFLSGMKLARSGDFGAAAPQIACAYLLDTRSILCVPSHLTGSINPAKKHFYLDFKLLNELIEKQDQQSFARTVLIILKANLYGENREYGQTLVANAMKGIGQLLYEIEVDRELENPEKFILGGCMKRTVLYYLRSSFHMLMGNRKQALRDLTKALDIDEFWTPARFARVSIWAMTNMKSSKQIQEEYRRILEENHEDNRSNEVAYAWLALTTLDDPTLGTYDDAKMYYDKCLKAIKRRDEIYGKRPESDLSPTVVLALKRFKLGIAAPSGLNYDVNIDNYSCVNCGALKKPSGGKLMKCARCKKVCYCSKECQKANWKIHKSFCKVMKDDKAAFRQPAPQSAPETYPVSKVEDMVAKEKIDHWTSMQLSAKRLQAELKCSYQKYGQSFSGWWRDMGRTERAELLHAVTAQTIPLRKPSDKKIQRELSACASRSRALFEYNVHALCGSCDCGESCDHFSNEKVIHEISGWVSNPEKKDAENFSTSNEKIKSGIFPNCFGESLLFVARHPEEDKLFGQPYPVPQNKVQEQLDLVEHGLAYDASAAVFAVNRKVLALSLLVKLFDVFKHKARRQPTTNPVERLLGCVNCGGSCQSSSSKRCSTCKVTWYCCEGCLIEHGHQNCPLGFPRDFIIDFD